jgi:hypothetical protein
VTGPIVDTKNYSVVCAGVQRASLTHDEVLAYAEKLNREWTELGYRCGRRADVFYRDGSLVASFPLAENVCPRCMSVDTTTCDDAASNCDRRENAPLAHHCGNCGHAWPVKENSHYAS